MLDLELELLRPLLNRREKQDRQRGSHQGTWLIVE
jgi:hypothetical protein